MDSNSIKNEIQKDLKRIDPDSDYYAITYLASEDGKTHWSVFSHWVGWVADKPGREIRAASLVNAEYLCKTWKDLGESYLVVNDVKYLFLSIRIGGHTVVEKSIAERYLHFIIEPHDTSYDGLFGFKDGENLPDSSLKRAPRPKLRMNIIKRDNYRCRICGRRPDDYTDIELHVHHILPWSKGGLTEEENLITLCNTCHKGLDPHSDSSLFSLLDIEKWDLTSEVRKRRYYEGLKRYREIAHEQFKELKLIK